MRRDFSKYLSKHHNIPSSYSEDYFKKIKSNTPHIIDDSVSGVVIDVYSKLIENRIIFLSTEMDADVCNIIKAQLLYLESIDSNKDIKIYIDSGGGSVYSGMGLLDVMEYVRPDISTVNTGLAASMAAVLLCSGAKGKRKSLKRSRTMVHQPMTYGSWVQQASDVEIEAKEINSLKRELYEIISEKTGQPYSKVFEDGDRDYWMTSKDALDYGMIDEILIKR